MLRAARREHRDRALSLGAVRLFAESLADSLPAADVNLRSMASAGLSAFPDTDELKGQDPRTTSYIDQFLAGCPKSCFATLLEETGDASALTALSYLHLFARSEAHHGQLLDEVLLRAVVSSAYRCSAAYPGPSYFLVILLTGPRAAEAAHAIVAAGGIKYLYSALSLGGDEAQNAAASLSAISRTSPALEAVVRAGAAGSGLGPLQLMKLFLTLKRTP